MISCCSTARNTSNGSVCLYTWSVGLKDAFGEVGFKKLLRADLTDVADTMELMLNLRSRVGETGVVGSTESS